MAVISPVAFLPDTPTLESAMARVKRQFIIDGITVTRSSLIGYGKFDVHTDSGARYVYEWSHVTGTKLVA